MTTRILLADDHEIVRQGLRLLLQREGFEVIGEAANGQEAIRLAAENCPDVAVLDYGDRKSTRLNSSHSQISYAVFCLKKKTVMYILTPCASTLRAHPHSAT